MSSSTDRPSGRSGPGMGSVRSSSSATAVGRRYVIADTDARVLTMFGTRFREMKLTMPDVADRLQDLVRERNQPATDVEG
jgi:hypothetical protein